MSNSMKEVESGIPVEKALQEAVDTSTQTWERGTTSIALIETYNPELSVYGEDPFPGGKLPQVEVKNVRGLQYAQQFIKTDSDRLQPDEGECHAWRRDAF